MRVIVQKYGGSSVADIQCIQMVAQRIVRAVDEGWSVVVVVSAMGNTTNELLRLANQVTSEPGRRELDLLISVGERVSMTLLAMAVQKLGYDAQSFTGSQSGIITDENHASARILEVRPARIQRALEAGCVAIVAGFQGMSTSKEVTTLGRGGSDASAVALAAALNAEFCEICSDVDGVYSADPRAVDAAYRHEKIGVDAMLTASMRGAKVLQAEALELAKKMGIRLRANATKRPAGGGTLITPEAQPTDLIVSLEKQVAWFPICQKQDLLSFEDQIMFLKPIDQALSVVVKTANIHGELPKNARTDVAVLSILIREHRKPIAFDCLAFLEEETTVYDWWHSDGMLSVLLAGVNLDALQAKVHELLLM